jgi:hypothetical protein
MAGLKSYESALRFSGVQVTPDEVWGIQTYDVFNPSIDVQWFGTCAGTQTQSIALTAINKWADYPRNLLFSLTTAAGSVKGATATINGKDQFGSSMTENIVVAPAVAGGTTAGTKIFSYVSSGTCYFGTGDAGNGTMQIGCGTAGSTTLFGFPFRLGGTSDLKQITGSLNGVGTSTSGTFMFGGTPSSAAVTTSHAFKAPRDLQAGTFYIRTWVTPTGDSTNDGPMVTYGTSTGPIASQVTG